MGCTSQHFRPRRVSGQHRPLKLWSDCSYISNHQLIAHRNRQCLHLEMGKTTGPHVLFLCSSPSPTRFTVTFENFRTHFTSPSFGECAGEPQYRPQANIVDCPALSAAGAYRWRGRGKWRNANGHRVLSGVRLSVR